MLEYLIAKGLQQANFPIPGHLHSMSHVFSVNSTYIAGNVTVPILKDGEINPDFDTLFLLVQSKTLAHYEAMEWGSTGEKYPSRMYVMFKDEPTYSDPVTFKVISALCLADLTPD